MKLVREMLMGGVDVMGRREKVSKVKRVDEVDEVLDRRTSSAILNQLTFPELRSSLTFAESR